MIFFKTIEEKNEFPKLDRRVMALLFVVTGLAWFEKEYHIIVTECLRTKKEDEKYGSVGIHQTGRAVDFNFCRENLERIQDPVYAERIMTRINETAPYGSGPYQSLIHHDIGYGAHFHLQVNPFGKTEIFK